MASISLRRCARKRSQCQRKFATEAPIGRAASSAKRQFSHTSVWLLLASVSLCTFPPLKIEISCIYALDTGAQPLVSQDGQQILAVNGEIYNHAALRKNVGPDVKFRTHSDCEVILPLVSPATQHILGRSSSASSDSTRNTTSRYAGYWTECSLLFY
jgi:hypothetical protein